MKSKRTIYLTENRMKIIDFCKSNDGKISKAQIMTLLKNGKCSCDLAYEVSKSMIEAGILEKTGKCKYKLVAHPST